MHRRDLVNAGKMPQFGSFKYSAQRFYDKGILLSIENYSPRQFDKLDIVLSSDAVGVFTIEIFNHTLGITNRMATADVKMEDLLQAQFDDRASISLFNGLAKFNLSLLLWQINKKYVSLLALGILTDSLLQVLSIATCTSVYFLSAAVTTPVMT